MTGGYYTGQHRPSHCGASFKNVLDVKATCGPDGWLTSQSSVTEALVTVGLSLRVILFVVAKTGNYPIFHQWENGRTNYGTSIYTQLFNNDYEKMEVRALSTALEGCFGHIPK